MLLVIVENDVNFEAMFRSLPIDVSNGEVCSPRATAVEDDDNHHLSYALNWW